MIWSMSRAQLTDAEAMALSNVVDWWIPSVRGAGPMRSLGEAILWAAAQSETDKITLFRPPGGDATSIWIFPEQVRRLCALFQGLVLGGVGAGTSDAVVKS